MFLGFGEYWGVLWGIPRKWPETPKKPEKRSKNGVFGGSKIGGKKPEKNTFFDVF